MPSPRSKPTPTQARHDLGLSGAVIGVIPPAEELPPSGATPGPNSQRVREASPGVHGGTAGMLERRDPDAVEAERRNNEKAAKNAEKDRAKADADVEAAREARRQELADAEAARAEAQPTIDKQNEKVRREFEKVAEALTSDTPGEEPDEPDDLASATRKDLYAEAQELDIAGRSSMTRDELEAAVREARTPPADATVNDERVSGEGNLMDIPTPDVTPDGPDDPAKSDADDPHGTPERARRTEAEESR